MESMYLIQRAKIQRPLGDFRNLRLSQAVSFDYMGSAEFEFGALPKSFRAIEKGMEKATTRVVFEIMDGEGPLRVFSMFNDSEFAEYLEQLLKLRTDKLRLKERSEFEPLNYRGEKYPTDFWWDVENHAMFSFDKNFMNHLTDYLSASLNYMNDPK